MLHRQTPSLWMYDIKRIRIIRDFEAKSSFFWKLINDPQILSLECIN